MDKLDSSSLPSGYANPYPPFQCQGHLVSMSFNRYANSELDAINSATQKPIRLPPLLTSGVRSMRLSKRVDALIWSQSALQSAMPRSCIDWIEFDFQISD